MAASVTKPLPVSGIGVDHAARKLSPTCSFSQSAPAGPLPPGTKQSPMALMAKVSAQRLLSSRIVL